MKLSNADENGDDEEDEDSKKISDKINGIINEGLVDVEPKVSLLKLDGDENEGKNSNLS